MRTLLLSLLLLASGELLAQNPIHAMAVSNWREGPVYLSPVFPTTEAATDAALTETLYATYPVLAKSGDMDILRFATPEEGEAHRNMLVAKYGVRGIEVVLLGPDGIGTRETKE